MQVDLNKYSIANGIKIATFILEYPRIIHAELMTHRVFSRNSASSRAIPTKAIIANLRENPAQIVWWGKNMGGMQAKEELSGWRLFLAKAIWRTAMELAILIARVFSLVGLHKQIANRVLEPFQNIRIVLTSTEWNNWFALRDHEAAQPEIAQLAAMMKLAFERAEPTELQPGEWHIPYIKTVKTETRTVYHVWVSEGSFYREVNLEEALRISASLAAQESYRKSDSSLAKANDIYVRLVASAPVHASPFEHQAQAMEVSSTYYLNEYGADANEKVLLMLNTPGYTHIDKHGQYWSGNFRGWVQHRQLISNHVVPG